MIHKLSLLVAIVITIALLPFAFTAAQSKRKPIPVGELFRNNCARCHGVDGRGDTEQGQKYNVPDFTNKDWWRRNPTFKRSSTLTSIVTQGRQEMPAFGKKLSSAEIKQLANYVRKFAS